MAHMFVLVMLITVIWTPAGNPVVNAVREPTIKACKLDRQSFIDAEHVVNIGVAPTLTDEWAAECKLFTSTIEEDI